MLNNNDTEWEELIMGTVYYTGDGKCINISLQEKGQNQLVNWRIGAGQYLTQALYRGGEENNSELRNQCFYSNHKIKGSKVNSGLSGLGKGALRVSILGCLSIGPL